MGRLTGPPTRLPQGERPPLTPTAPPATVPARHDELPTRLRMGERPPLTPLAPPQAQPARQGDRGDSGKERGQLTPWVGREKQRWTASGWAAMYDSREPGSEQEGEAPIYLNLDPVDRERPGALMLRPGQQRIIPLTGGANTLQLPTLTYWQGIKGIDFGGSTGFKVLVVSGGEVYQLQQWDSDNLATLTKVLSTAQLAAAGITLVTTAVNRVYIVQFGKTAVIADEQGNAPFVWNGTTGGGLTKLTNAPLSRTGGPTVYFAKLFWLKNGTSTIVWSEENQPNTGYEAGGYNNAWDLNQTSGSIIQRILGTNDGLYLFRMQSVGVIRGAVSTTFASDGTHDSISESIGIGLLSDPMEMAGAVWWRDNVGFPRVYRADVGVVDPMRQIPRRRSTEGVFTPDLTYLGSVGEQYLNTALTFGHFNPDPANGIMHLEVGSPLRVAFLFDATTFRLVALHTYSATLNVPNINSIWSHITLTDTSSSPSRYYKVYCDQNGNLFRQPIIARNSSLPGITGADETTSSTGASRSSGP